jgi:ferredoxin/DMSO/TMAO reductase YedYZ heme-binding membrane subunit
VFSQTVHAVAATVGFTSWLLLWAALVLGLVVRNGWASTRLRNSTVEAAHMTLALLGLTLGVVHGGAQLAAPNGIIRLVDEVVPFVNPTDPVGVGAGVLSLELFLAGALSVPIRKRLGQSRWRAVHTLTYAAFILLTAHVLISGSDVGPTWLWMTIVAAAAIVVLLWLASTRLVSRVRTRLGRRSTARDRAQTLMIDVDPTRCQRFGFCEHEAPEVFRLQSDGRLAYRTYVPAESVDPVIRAVGVCPARAIALRRLPTTVVTADTGPIPQITPAGGVPQPTPLRSGAIPGLPVGAGAPSPSASRSSRTQTRAERRGRGR